MSKPKTEDQHELNKIRTRAVNQAKRDEVELVREGKGTRDWTPDQQREWLRTGKCEGIKGHHMKDVSNHPEYAGDRNNIQMLTHKEHYDAHGGNYKNSTNGYYNPKTGKTMDFGDSPPHKPAPQKLSNPLSERSVKYNTTMKRNADAQKAEARKLKAVGETKAASKAHVPEKRSIPEKTDSKTLSRDREKTPAREAASSESKTLNRDRAKSASETSKRPSSGESHSHRMSHSH